MLLHFFRFSFFTFHFSLPPLLRFFLFLKNFQKVLLFIVLEVVAGWFFFTSNLYQKAKFANASNVVIGYLYDKWTGAADFFSLAARNRELALENATLRTQLELYGSLDLDSIATELGDDYIAVEVVKNSYAKRNNFITINKGRLQGIKPEMALVSGRGIVGYVLDCSDNFSIAISVLNMNDFRTGGKIKGSDFNGSILWNGMSHRMVQMVEIPKYAQLQVGDTILVEYSNIFPKEYPIGTVTDFELINGTFFKANVELFADMARLKYLYAVQIPLQQERRELEKTVDE